MLFIPVDRIAMEYAVCGDDRKAAVTNIIQSSSYLSATLGSDGASLLNWKASPSVSLHFALGIIQTGKKEYGDLWLNELKNKLSQME